MSDDVLTKLNPSTRVLKRAQYEAFAFSLLDCDVIVRNESHATPADHEYCVRIDDGVPTTCDCPADAFYSGPCKHRVAVAIRSRILDAVNAMQRTSDRRRKPQVLQESDEQIAV